MAQVEAVTEALRRRIGEHFSLAQLVGIYGGDDGWVYEAVAERADRPGWTASCRSRKMRRFIAMRAGRDGLHAAEHLPASAGVASAAPVSSAG